MKDYCGYFRLAQDMNNDGKFSISDIWQIIEFVWLVPAKGAMYLITNYLPLAEFLEIDCFTGTSWGGGIFSLFVWLLVLVYLVGVIEYISTLSSELKSDFNDFQFKTKEAKTALKEITAYTIIFSFIGIIIYVAGY